MVLSDGEQIIQAPLPGDFSIAGVKRGIEAALKRFSSGFLKTVALYTPKASPSFPQLGMQGSGLHFTLLKDHLRQSALVDETDLSSGQVGDDADLLMVVAPENLDDKQRFAIDQFLMQGGTVVLASSAYQLTSQGGLGVAALDSGLSDWLEHLGISIEPQMVLDPQNTPFPAPVQRDLGGFTVQELRMIDYPYFIDVRETGMDKASGLLAGIAQLTLNWASPITLGEGGSYQMIPLLRSSSQSWTSSNTGMQPDFQRYGELGFPVGDNLGSKLLAVSVEGSFGSYYQGKASPLLTSEAEELTGQQTLKLNRVIEKSPESARLILFASNSFLSDDVINLASSASGNLYTNALQVMANTVDWALEDRGLLEIRGRDHFSRTLGPLEKEQQQFWEYLNYAAGLAGLLVIYIVLRISRLRAQAGYRQLLHKEV
jgi:ABC-2 type transport system permease protein